MKTINKLRLWGFSDDALSKITNFPTTDLISDYIVGCLMVAIIRSNVQALQFCDIMNKLVDSKSSKTLIEMLKNGKYIKNYVKR